MTVNTGDIIEIAVHGSVVGGKEMVNVYTTKYEGNASVPDATVVSAARTWLLSLMSQVMSILVQEASYSFAKLYNRTQSAEMGQTNLSFAGIAAEDSLPSGVAALSTGRTVFGKSRGRKFLWGLGDSKTEDQALTAAALAALTAFAAKWIEGTSWDAGTKRLVSGIIRTLSGTFTPLTVTSASGTPAYQRRRKPNR